MIKKQRGTCLLHAVANSLLDPRILDHEDDFNPCNITQMQKILAKTDWGIELIPLINSFMWDIAIPFEYFDTVIKGIIKGLDTLESFSYIPFILTVMLKGGISEESLHAVSLYVKNDGFYFKDSLNNKMEKIELVDLIDKYDYIQRVRYLGTFKDIYGFHHTSKAFLP